MIILILVPPVYEVVWSKLQEEKNHKVVKKGHHSKNLPFSTWAGCSRKVTK
jgi:hypothetical protein